MGYGQTLCYGNSVREAQKWVLDWIEGNKFSFNRYGDEDNWGKIENGFAVVRKDIFKCYVENAGFVYSWLVREFADRKWLIKNSQGKYVQQTAVYGLKASYVKLNITKMKVSDCVIKEGISVESMSQSIRQEISKGIMEKVKNRDYKVEPYELESMAKAAAKIITIVTGCSYSRPYEKGKIILGMAMDMIDRAEGKE